MAALFDYNFKMSVCISFIYVFYFLILRNLTFYNWNRWYLLVGTGFSFIIPLTNITSFLQSEKTNNSKVLKFIPTLNNFHDSAEYASRSSFFIEEYFYQILAILFGLGMLVQAGKLIVQFVSFYQLRKSAVKLPYSKLNIYQVGKEIAPFSFGNAIFLNQDLIQPDELPKILRHEQVHVEQKHTVDMLWLEFICLVNWFNPFAWLLKQSVRQNLEFIADQVVLLTLDADKKYYQYLMLKIIGLPHFTIANQFNISPLKTRIKMMNKMPSNKRELVKFLLVFPVMAILLLACSDNELLLKPPLPSPVLNEAVGLNKPFPLEFFSKRNPGAKILSFKAEDTTIVSMTVMLQTGQIEKYNFKNANELATFEQKYGKYVLTVPSPTVDPSAIRILFLKNAPADYQSFIKRNPKFKYIGWSDNGFIHMYSKSGREEDNEVYNVNDATSKANAEKKYGKLPQNPFLKSGNQITDKN